MDGASHYREAERILAILDEKHDPEEWDAKVKAGGVHIAMAAAQVHATLALADATAITSVSIEEQDDEPDPGDYDPGPECDDEGGMTEYRYVMAEDYQRGQA